MRLFLQDADRASWQDLSVLIQGESGTGKSVFARYLHEAGSRKSGPFVSINCASIPHNLIESELFGYEKGAFTGASPQGRKGLFELANGGTLFLDEIGDLPLPAQAKILDVIENKRFIPIGGRDMVHVDVRIICATNRDLRKLIQEKKFREDLYWRINIIELDVPALRQRPEDVEFYPSSSCGSAVTSIRPTSCLRRRSFGSSRYITGREICASCLTSWNAAILCQRASTFRHLIFRMSYSAGMPQIWVIPIFSAIGIARSSPKPFASTGLRERRPPR